MTAPYDLCVLAVVLAFAGGVRLGILIRDFRWIEKGRDGFRMAARGGLWRVMPSEAADILERRLEELAAENARLRAALEGKA